MIEREPTSQAIHDVLPPLLVTVQQHRRVRSSDLMTALGCLAKPLGRAMRALGFEGPMALRFPRGDGTSLVASGYQRPIQQDEQVGADVGEGVAVGADQSDDLPHRLEVVTRMSLKELRRILRLPLDETNGNLLRAKVTASLGVLQSQLRADTSRMRVRVAGDVLSRLEKLVREQSKLLPKEAVSVGGLIEADVVEVEPSSKA